jgi:lipopolysaccharide transport system ATP-binding protein
MSAPRIVVDSLGKRFPLRSGTRVWSLGGLRSSLRSPGRADHFWALRDVSFSVGPGEMLGIIGSNGAGKSTLLRLLGGVGRPTCGRVEVHGSLGALLDLGTGFVPDLSGRENARLAAIVTGLLRQEADLRLPEIVAFAELEDVIDEPVRTYSSGMLMRLAFSVAVHADPDVLLVDEFLSVGDLAFQAKCQARIQALRQGGCSILLVSHGMEQIRLLCDRALWLRSGQVAACGSPDSVAAAYESAMREETLRRTPPDAAPDATAPGEQRSGSREVEITGVRLAPGDVLTSGSPLEVEIDFHAPRRVPTPVFMLSLSRPDGTICLDTNTLAARVDVPDAEGPGRIVLSFDRLELARGEYHLNVGVFETDWSHAYDFRYQHRRIVVEGAPAHCGIAAPPVRWALAAPGDTPSQEPPAVSAPVSPEREEGLVSVVIPAHNAAATLAETIRSVQAQTYPRIEILVVDDGSTDDTADIAASFAAADSRVRFLRQANAGVAAARNTGIQAARGAFIAPLDADDLWHPEKLAAQVALARDTPGVGFVYSLSRVIDENSLVVASRWPYLCRGDVYFRHLMMNFVGNGSALLIPAAVLDQVGLFNEDLRRAGIEGCEDWDLQLRIAERFPVAVTPSYLVGYRRMPGQMSRNGLRMIRSSVAVAEHYFGRSPTAPPALRRWSFGIKLAHRAVIHLRAGNPSGAAASLASAVAHDPAVGLCETWSLASTGWERLTSRVHAHPTAPSRHFLHWAPWEDADERRTAPFYNRLMQRRLDLLAACPRSGFSAVPVRHESSALVQPREAAGV